MEQKHPHRVAIEYLTKVLEGKETHSDSRVAAAEAILRTDFYAFEDHEPVDYTVTELDNRTVTFDTKSDSDTDKLPKLEVITGRLGKPVQLKVSIPGEPEKFPGCFIEFPELPEGDDSWLVYAPGLRDPVYRVLSDGSVIKPTEPFDMVEESTPYVPPPEIYPGSNTDVQGSAEPPVFFRLNKATGEELKVSAWDNQAGKVVNDYMKEKLNKYPSPGTIEAVKILDDARYLGCRWRFVWLDADPRETRTHHPNPKVCNCIEPFDYAQEPMCSRSRISEDEAIYLAAKIAKRETNRKMYEDGAPKPGLSEEVQQGKRAFGTRLTDFLEPGMPTEVKEATITVSTKEPCTNGSPKPWKLNEAYEAFDALTGKQQTEFTKKITSTPEPMTLERAVEVLNLREHRGISNWQASCGARDGAGGYVYSEPNHKNTFLPEEVIAIAKYLERESK